MYFKTYSKYECTACSACKHICPVKAISFHLDEEGFLFPSIDKNICINCGLCERICPIEHPINSHRSSLNVYAAILKDIEQRKKSSSGGIFYAIACWVLEQGGKVYGVTIDDAHKVKHIYVEKLEDLHLLRGSKYVQSDLQDLFDDIKKELIKERWCYFVGTGCQVAGLRAFLCKDYKTLLTTDLVCHGVPSQWLFDQHVKLIETKYRGKLISYAFRDNNKWCGSEILTLNIGSKLKTIKNPTYFKSPYLNAFISSMVLRYSCYDCKYATIHRVGDITLADYWGIENFIPNIDKRYGVSMMMINTNKGEYIRKQIAKNCIFWETTISEAIKYNSSIIHTTSMPEIRPHIYKLIQEKGYPYVAETIFKSKRYYKTIIVQTLLSNNIIKKVVVPILNLFRI